MIIGTAGHIDHGKTALVRALTGMETDRLQEEKDRGMSIDLGFAFMDLGQGRKAGIIDVPGHEHFIRNMVAGTHGMDMVLLVIAADDGIMPQTKEHLEIIDLLGISRLIVAITKIDVVDKTTVERVKTEVKDFLTSAKFGEIFMAPVSSTTGEGIDDLKAAIEKEAAKLAERARSGFFRMPVDRAFTVKGFGTVVTGTVISGKVSVGDSIRLFPGGRELRIRNIESYGEKRDSIAGGERAAVNIPVIEKNTINRGDVLVSTTLSRETLRFDAKINSAAFSSKRIKAGERVHLHTGTADVIAKIFPLASNKLYASLAPMKPLHIMRGDRFVIRDYSAQRTLGGGVVINPFPPQMKGKERSPYFSLWDKGNVIELCRDITRRSSGIEKIDAISENLNTPPEEICSILERETGFRLVGEEVILVQLLDDMGVEIKDILDDFHKNNPSSEGMEPETVRQKLSQKLSPRLFKEVLEDLIKRGELERYKEEIKLKGKDVSLSPQEIKGREAITSILREKGFQTASSPEMAGRDKKISGYLSAMVKEGKAVQLSRDNFIEAGLLEEAKRLLLSHFEKNGALTVIEFKNLLGAGRKGAILILEYFDNIHLTVRRGDERVLLKNNI